VSRPKAPLEGKVALVTGGGRGLGRGIALKLAVDGAAVVICDLAAEEAGLAESAALIERAGGRCLRCAADVRIVADLERAVELACAELGRLDLLVANAGIVRAAPLLELPAEDWQATIDVDLTGAFNSIRAAAPPMIARGEGRIVVVSSVSGRHGQPRLGAYNAAKWGTIGLVKAAALELGPAGVTVNAVCPGTVDTPLIHHPDAPAEFLPDAEQPTWEALLELLRSWNAMGVPWVDPAEVAAAVAFLASDDAKHISGTTLDVAAGWNARYAT
jgi:NAD(P)-dependent dehydrogenase (short-subunit alcohol dehydrogenase family)